MRCTPVPSVTNSGQIKSTWLHTSVQLTNSLSVTNVIKHMLASRVWLSTSRQHTLVRGTNVHSVVNSTVQQLISGVTSHQYMRGLRSSTVPSVTTVLIRSRIYRNMSTLILTLNLTSALTVSTAVLNQVIYQDTSLNNTPIRSTPVSTVVVV